MRGTQADTGARHLPPPSPPTCMAQKARKQAACARVMPSQATTAPPPSAPPASVCAIWWMAAPPSHVLRPNQHAATQPRSTAGRMAPRMPKLLRASTGKGTCGGR